MKRLLFCFTIVIALLSFASCKGQTTYEPHFVLSPEYTLDGERIVGTVIGMDSVLISDLIQTPEAVIVFADSSSEQYVEGDDARIPLNVGENHLILRLTDGENEKEYYLDIEYIAIRSFSVEMIAPEKTYHIGEAFDKSSVVVRAVTESGEEVMIDHYTPEYEFSMLGKATVGIELGGMYESFSVSVTDEYRPTLDETFCADDVSYAIVNGEAILIDATETKGFFAVPPTVIYANREYSVTQIEHLAFENAEITGVRIPDSVRRIGGQAFSGCRLLEWAEMPEEMETIEALAFADCESLFSIDIPKGIEALADGVFRDCAALVLVDLPSGLKSIGARTFLNCSALSSVELPKTVRSIGDSAFRGCAALTTIVAERLERICDSAFADCTALTAFAVADVDEIGSNVFDGCVNLIVYGAQGSNLVRMMSFLGIQTAVLNGDEPFVVSLPDEFAIEEDFPYRDVLILHLKEGKMSRLVDYAIEYPKDACGYLTATLTSGDFIREFRIFIAYTEDVALDTDSRGVVYELNSVTKLARLVSAPAWVRNSDIYVPEEEGLFLVPTTLWRNGEFYVVIEVADGAFDECINVETVFEPILMTE